LTDDDETMRRLQSPANVKLWSSAELQQLRELSDAGIGVEIIAARLRRTVSAVRNKACMHGFPISGAQRPRPVP
jgi:hypothetical protein